MNKNYFFHMKTLNALVEKREIFRHTQDTFFSASLHFADYHSRAAFFLSSSNIFRPA
jgi:hypothetical protein